MLDISLPGTGGTVPHLERFLSSCYMRADGVGLLIDCGEGTQVGVQKLGWGMQCIDGILISHFHADHCSGLPGMLLALTKAMRTEPLHIYGPVGLTQVVNGLRVIAPQLTFPVILHEITGQTEFELIGMKVICGEETLGEITDVLDYPGNSVYVVKGEHEYMIPAVKAFILDTNIADNRMEVKLIEGMRSDEN